MAKRLINGQFVSVDPDPKKRDEEDDDYLVRLKRLDNSDNPANIFTGMLSPAGNKERDRPGLDGKAKHPETFGKDINLPVEKKVMGAPRGDQKITTRPRVTKVDLRKD